MTNFSIIVGQYREAKANGSPSVEDIKKQLLDYELPSINEESLTISENSEENRIHEDFYQCLESARPDEKDLFLEIFKKNSKNISFGPFMNFATKNILNLEQQTYVVNLFDALDETKKDFFKMNLPPIFSFQSQDFPGWEEKLFSIPHFFNQKQIDETYINNFQYHQNDKLEEVLLSKNLVSPEAQLTKQAYEALEKDELSEEALEDYLHKGVKADSLVSAILIKRELKLFEILVKNESSLLSDPNLLLLAMNATQLPEYLILNFLIKNNVALNIPFSRTVSPSQIDKTPLLFALTNGTFELINILLNSKLDLNLNHIVESENVMESISLKDETALSVCIREEHFDLAEKIIVRDDVDVTLPDNKPFQYALDKKNYAFAILIHQRTPKNSPFFEKQREALYPMLLEAIKVNDITAVETLLSMGVDFKQNELEAIKNLLTLHQNQRFDDTTFLPMIKMFIKQGVSISTLIQIEIEMYKSKSKLGKENDVINFFNAANTEEDIEACCEYLKNFGSDPYSNTIKIFANNLFTKEIYEDKQAQQNLLEIFRRLPKEIQTNILVRFVDKVADGTLPTEDMPFYLKLLSDTQPRIEVIDMAYLSPVLRGFFPQEAKVSLHEAFRAYLSPSDKALRTSEAIEEMRTKGISDEQLSRYLKEGIYVDKLLLSAVQNENDCSKEVDYLFTHVKDLNVQEALELSLWNRNPNLLQVLLKHKVPTNTTTCVAFDRNSNNFEDLTPLMMLLKIETVHRFDRSAMIGVLLNADVDININHVVSKHEDVDFDIDGESALSFAIKQGWNGFAEMLIARKDIDVTIPDNRAFQYALDNHSYKLAILIHQKTSKISPFFEQQQKAFFPVLLEAIRKNDQNTVEELLAIGVDLKQNELEAIRLALILTRTSGGDFSPIIKMFLKYGLPLSALFDMQKEIEMHAPRNEQWKNGEFVIYFDAAKTEEDIEACCQYLEHCQENSVDRGIALYSEALFTQKNYLRIFKKLTKETQTKVLTNYVNQLTTQAVSTVDVQAHFKMLSEMQLSNEVIDRVYLIPALGEYFPQEARASLLEGFRTYLPPSHKAMLTATAAKEMKDSGMSDEQLAKYLKEGIYADELLLSAAQCEDDRSKEVDYLLTHVSDLNAQEALEIALWGKNTNLLQVLLKHKAPANATTPITNSSYFRDLTPLMILLKIEQVNGENKGEMITALLSADVDIGINHVAHEHSDPSFGINGESVLSYAILQGWNGLAQMLITRKDIDITIPNNKPLIQALKIGNYELAKLIYQRDPQKAKLPEEEAHLLLMEAVRSNDADKVKYLLEMGVYWNYNNEEAIKYAISNGKEEALNGLIQGGMPQERILYWAAKLAEWETVSSYIRQNLPRTDPVTHEVLLEAIRQSQTYWVEFLLRNGVKATTNQSEALLIAINAERPSSKIVQILIDCGADRKSHGCLLSLKVLEQYAVSPYFNGKERLDILKILLKDIVQSELLDDLLANFSLGILSYGDAKKLITDCIRGSLSPSQQAAFDLLVVNEEVKNLSRFEGESAMERALTKRSNTLWAEMQIGLKSTFEQYPGNTTMEKVAALEKEIKEFLLDEMIANADLSIDPKSKVFKQFIVENKQALIEGTDDVLMQKMRVFVVSNEENAQIAWRGYDPKIPHDPSWPNWLTPSSDTRSAFTTAASFSGQRSNQEISDEMRTRVAYAFLAKPNTSNFLQQLADIRRAPDHPNTPTRDSPTCGPGAIGRWGKIFEKGNKEEKFKLPPDRRQMMLSVVNEKILNAFSNKLKTLNENELDKFYFAITTLTTNVAVDIVADKIPFDEELLKIRQDFIKDLGELNEIINQINEVLGRENEEPLSPHELIHLKLELLELGGSGRSMEMADQRKKAKKQFKKNKEKEKDKDLEVKVEIKPQEKTFNPFKPTPLTSRFFNASMFERSIRKFVEFEMLFPIIYNKCSQNGYGYDPILGE